MTMNVRLSNITKAYGSKKILDNMSVTFNPGQITAVLGDNGEGKTTLLNIINGYVAPDSGRIHIGEEDLTGFPSYRIARKGVARLFQEIRLFTSISVLENVMVGIGHQSGENPISGLLSPRIVNHEKKRCVEMARNLLHSVGLEEFESKNPAQLSYGESKLVAIAILLATKPAVLLLDEPLAGLSRDNVLMVTEILRSIKKRGKTILVVEHNRDFIEDFVDVKMVLKDGLISMNGVLGGAEDAGR